MVKLLYIMAAGALGTLTRYGLTELVKRHAPEQFPWGTFAVNLVGCFAFGIVWAFTEERVEFSQEVRTAVLVGFMGAFTTFSTFAFDSSWLLKEGHWMMALGNVVGQTVLGVLLLFAGLAVGRQL